MSGKKRSFTDGVIRLLRKSSISKRLVALLIIAVLLPTMVLSAVSLSVIADEIEQNNAMYMDQYVSGMADSVSDLLEKYEMQILSVAAEIRDNGLLRGEPDAAAINKYLYLAGVKYNDFVSIQLVTPSAQYTQQLTQDEKEGWRIKEPDSFYSSELYLNAVKAKAEPVWYAPDEETVLFETQGSAIDIISGYIAIAVNIIDNDTSRGTVVASLPVSALSDAFIENDVAGQGSVILVGKFGMIADLSKNSNVILPKMDSIKKAYMDKSVDFISNYQGDAYHNYCQSISQGEWVVMATLPGKVVFEPMGRFTLIVVLTGGGLALLTFLVAYFVILSVLSPINKLKDAMGAVDGQRVSIEYQDDNNDEIGVLSMKFNGMIRSINNLIEQIYKAEQSKRQEMTRRKDAEFNALQMQVNPHIIYNTLDIIRWQVMAYEKGNGKVSNMISDFSSLLRLSIKKSNNLVPFSEEMTHASAYVRVINFRSEDNVVLKWDVTEEAENCYINKLTLQPLVENAIKYGAQDDEALHIEISAKVEQELFIIEVRDNGRGMHIQEINAMNRELSSGDEISNKIGLKNVNSRIKLNFGEQYGLTLKENEPKGLKVIISLPVIKK